MGVKERRNKKGKESTEFILQHLDKLGEKLGVAADKIWPWFIKQIYVEAVVSTVTLLIVCTITYFFLRFIHKHWEPDQYSDEVIYSITRSCHEPAYFAASVLLGIMLVVFFIGFVSVIPRIFNVEYFALTNLMDHIK